MQSVRSTCTEAGAAGGELIPECTGCGAAALDSRLPCLHADVCCAFPAPIPVGNGHSLLDLVVALHREAQLSWQNVVLSRNIMSAFASGLASEQLLKVSSELLIRAGRPAEARAAADKACLACPSSAALWQQRLALHAQHLALQVCISHSGL